MHAPAGVTEGTVQLQPGGPDSLEDFCSYDMVSD